MSRINKRATGLYEKFTVRRTDGRDAPGKKHEGCEYFVLDLTHDRFAPAALTAYAKECHRAYPMLSMDLINKAIEIEKERYIARLPRRGRRGRIRPSGDAPSTEAK